MAEVKTRVLIVDDDCAVRCSVRLALESRGYDVREACDGAEGVLLQENSPHDIAIVDMIMPKKDGIETIIEMKEKFPNLNILAISDSDNLVKKDFLPEALLLGATAALRKPFGGDQLLNVLNGFVAA